ncbi:MAG: hypothetical protein L0L65_10510, partial [Tetragenococcus halophilus]|nr:hypothetical protein [Tetragenococcus halophilus]
MEALKKTEIKNQGKKYSSKKKIITAVFIFALVSFLMISPQLYKHSLILGNDMMFHFNRFYEAYMQIK